MTSTRVPKRIKSKSDIAKYFSGKQLDKVTSIWGTNTGCIVQADNDKFYWVSYKFKDTYNKYIETNIAKQNSDGTFKI